MIPHKHQLLEGDAASQMRTLSYPIIAGLLAVNASHLADVYFISRLGTEALAAFGFMLPVILIFMSIGWGLSIGASSVLSRAYGQKREDRARRHLTDSILIMTAVIIATSTVGLIVMEPLFRAMGASDRVMELVYDYMHIWYPGQCLMGFCSVANSALRATGDTRLSAIMMATTSILIIILDPILIFGFWIIPPMGMEGAALATVLAFLISAAILWGILRRRDMLAGAVSLTGFLASARKILHVGLPAVFTQMITPLSAAIIMWMVAGFGKEAVAAMAIAARIEAFVFIPYNSLSSAMMVFAGQNAGAGNYGRIHEATRASARYALFYSLIVAAILWAMAGTIPLWFDPSPVVAAFATHYLHIVPISLGFYGIVMISSSVFNGTGNPLPSVALMLSRGLVLYVPLAWIGKELYGFHGIMVATLCANIVMGLIAYGWSQRGSLRLASTIKQDMREDALPVTDKGSPA